MAAAITSADVARMSILASLRSCELTIRQGLEWRLNAA
jgi:hypothetical protein